MTRHNSNTGQAFLAVRIHTTDTDTTGKNTTDKHTYLRILERHHPLVGQLRKK